MYSDYPMNGFDDIPINGIDGSQILIMVLLLSPLIAWIVAVYIMRSKTLYCIAKRRGIPIYGMAWVPVLYVWTLGDIADRYDGNHGIKRLWRWALLILTLVGVVGYVVVAVFTVDFFSHIDFYSMAGPDLDPVMIGRFISLYVFEIVLIMAMAAFSACAIICTYKLFESCKPQSALKLLLLSILVPFAAPFCLRSCLKWDAGVKCGEWSSENTVKPALDGYTAPAEGYETNKNSSGDNYTPGK